MLAEFHQKEFSKDIRLIKSEFENNINLLVEGAKIANLQARPVNIDLKNIKLISKPCILEWANRYVVLCNYSHGQLTINDPMEGRYSCSTEEAEEHFTGNAVEIYGSINIQEDSSRLDLYNFYKSILGFRKNIFLIIIMSFFIMLVILATPIIMQTVIDRVIPTGDKNLINVLTIGLVALSIMELTMRSIRHLFIIHFFSQLNLQTLSNLLSHIVRAPINFFQTRHMGDIVSRFGSLEKLNIQMSQVIPELVVDCVTSLSMFAMMLIYNANLALVAISFFVLNILMRSHIFNSYREVERKGLEDHAKSATYFMETLRAIQSIKSFQKEDLRLNGWIERFINASNRDIQKGRLNLKTDLFHGILFSLENIIIIFFVSSSVVDGDISIGVMFAFLSYKIQFATRSESFLKSYFDIKLLNTHLSRVAELALHDKEKSKLEKKYSTGNFNSLLSVENVSFKFSQQADLVLNNVNFSISRGESVAIIGPSGRGKSTLLKIMTGLYVPLDGCCKLNNLDITEIADYQENISAVMQEDQLVQGSIMENITWFDQNFNKEYVYDCAKVAAIHDEILSFPDQYNTQVGDLGSTLSSGQKQRIMLARALYRKPKILFLDEATSHLDVENEQLINAKLREMSITRIVVAHRTSTILSADKIIDLSSHHLEIYASSEYSKKLDEAGKLSHA